jgi:hypothetical protein
MYGSRTADLPGFGTNWGSFGDLGMAQYEERAWNSWHGAGFRTNEDIGGRPGDRLIGWYYGGDTYFSLEEATRHSEGGRIFTVWDSETEFPGFESDDQGGWQIRHPDRWMQRDGKPQVKNPNCIRNAVKGSPGLARRFDPGKHDGVHARAPNSRSAVVVLPPLAGKVIYITTGGESDNTKIVDVRLNWGYVALLKDFTSVSVRVGSQVRPGETIGTVSGGGFGDFNGLHIALIRADQYDYYRKMTSQSEHGSTEALRVKAFSEISRLQEEGAFMDPLGPESPVNCPGESIIDYPVKRGLPTIYPPR